jgi:hypothetical protein
MMELSDGSRVCVDCESLFKLEDGERQYFETNNLTLPKRCKACRQLRKDLAHQADVDRAKEALRIREEDDDFLLLNELL